VTVNVLAIESASIRSEIARRGAEIVEDIRDLERQLVGEAATRATGDAEDERALADVMKQDAVTARLVEVLESLDTTEMQAAREGRGGDMHTLRFVQQAVYTRLNTVNFNRIPASRIAEVFRRMRTKAKAAA